jgi:hypothetical protein
MEGIYNSIVIDIPFPFFMFKLCNWNWYTILFNNQSEYEWTLVKLRIGYWLSLF